MARKDSKLEQLAQVRLFSACNRKELTRLGSVTEEVTRPAGTVLCEEGRTGHEFFLLLDGTASVKRGNRKVATLSTGQYFGELALLDRGPRNATVIADTDVRLLVLDQRSFGGVIDEIPAIAHKLLATMAARLRDADARDLGQ